MSELQARAKYQVFPELCSLSGTCRSRASTSYAICLGVNKGKTAAKLCSLHHQHPASSPITWHLRESFQSSVWHFGSTRQTEATICMKFTYIKVWRGGHHETPFGKKAKKSTWGCISLKLKGLVMDRTWECLLLTTTKNKTKQTKPCDLEPPWVVWHGNADDVQKQTGCTPWCCPLRALYLYAVSGGKMHS